MTEAERLFFLGKPEAEALWEALQNECLSRLAQYEIKVSKTQVSLYSGHLFACAALPRGKKGKLVVTFGLPAKVASPRIWQAAEPYPNRWTHHVLLSERAEINEELLNWLSAAQVFAMQKKR